VPCRVARWFVFKAKIQIWVNFGGSWNGRWWYILWTLGPFYGLLLYFMDIWFIVRGNLVYFSRFGTLYQEKSGNPGAVSNGRIESTERFWVANWNENEVQEHKRGEIEKQNTHAEQNRSTNAKTNV
jgi:hypothetical protein